MTAVPGMTGTMRARASRFRWKRPTALYPQFEALCACWAHQYAGKEIVLARHSQSEGELSPWDAMHYRECFKRIANRYGLYAGLQYNTFREGREIVLVKLSAPPGYPALAYHNSDVIEQAKALIEGGAVHK